MEQIKHLIAVIDIVKRYGTPETPEAAEWFLGGLNEYMLSKEYQSLDKVFGLTSQRGTPTQRTQYIKILRNNYLKAAYECIDPEKPPTIRCDILAQEIRSFDRMYLNWKKAGGPPELCSDLRKNIYLAKETGQTLPSTSRYLFYLIHGY